MLEGRKVLYYRYKNIASNPIIDFRLCNLIFNMSDVKGHISSQIIVVVGAMIDRHRRRDHDVTRILDSKVLVLTRLDCLVVLAPTHRLQYFEVNHGVAVRT